jgi:hypothetical protein
MLFSQQLNTAVFNSATQVLFKFSNAFRGLNPYERELILSASNLGPGTYKDAIASLVLFERQTATEVLNRMGHMQLVSDRKEFERQVQQLLQSSKPYRHLQQAVSTLRASKLQSQAILDSQFAVDSNTCINEGTQPPKAISSPGSGALPVSPSLAVSTNSSGTIKRGPPTEAPQSNKRTRLSNPTDDVSPSTRPSLPVTTYLIRLTDPILYGRFQSTNLPEGRWNELLMRH